MQTEAWNCVSPAVSSRHYRHARVLYGVNRFHLLLKQSFLISDKLRCAVTIEKVFVRPTPFSNGRRDIFIMRILDFADFVNKGINLLGKKRGNLPSLVFDEQRQQLR